MWQFFTGVCEDFQCTPLSRFKHSSLTLTTRPQAKKLHNYTPQAHTHTHRHARTCFCFVESVDFFFGGVVKRMCATTDNRHDAPARSCESMRRSASRRARCRRASASSRASRSFSRATDRRACKCTPQHTITRSFGLSCCTKVARVVPGISGDKTMMVTTCHIRFERSVSKCVRS